MKKVKLEYIKAGSEFVYDNDAYRKVADVKDNKTWIVQQDRVWEPTGVETVPSNVLVWIKDETDQKPVGQRKQYTCVEWVDVEIGEEVRLVASIMRQYSGTKIDANRLALGETFGNITVPHNSLVILEKQNGDQ